MLGLAAEVAGGTSIASGIMGSRAAKKAAKQQAAALEAAKRDVRAGQAETEGRLQPYVGANTGALSRLSDIILEGDTSNFYTSPGYQFRLEQGQRAVETGASANSRLFSGRTKKELQDFGQQMGSAEYANYLNQLNTLYSGTAPQATSYAELPYNTAGTIANLTTGQGAVQAQGTLGAANAWQGALNSIGGMAGNMAGGGASASNTAYKNFFGQSGGTRLA
jgi:hypothetical protein